MTPLSWRYDITHKVMSIDFTRLMADIEQEAQDEGPQAVRELEQFREEFGLPGSRRHRSLRPPQIRT